MTSSVRVDEELGPDAAGQMTGASVMHEVALCGRPKLPPRMWPMRWLNP